MKLIRTILLLIGFAAVCVAEEIQPRLTLPLTEGWRFVFADGSDAWASVRHDDSAWWVVSLPHTWNNFDGQDGGNDYARGTGWYRTHFKLPANAGDRRVLVEFDAACKVAEVFVNGTPVGTHTGAFARFRFDITHAVDMQGDNLLAVRVDNAPSQIIPRSGDFTQFGGLYRPARLLLTAPVHLATLDYASPGVYLTQRRVTAEQAVVDARVKLLNESGQAFEGTLRIRVQDTDGNMVATAERRIGIASGQSDEVSLPLTLARPRLWNGVADPHLYQAIVELVADGRVLDSVEQPLGLRAIEIDADRGFILNGQPLSVHGVNRHQDRLDRGWAISPAQHAEDFRLIQEVGANGIRLAHYQHDQVFYNLCDEGGMVVWAELCLVNEPPEEPAARENAREQLRELIRQNYNHPSIFCWSVGNETTGKNNDATMRSADQLLTDLAAVVREEDPARLSVYASHHSVNDPRNLRCDLVAFNKYYGWYGGDYPGLGRFLDQFHSAHPTVPAGISEYGAGASIYQHEEKPPVRNHQAKGPWHPEEWQTTYHEESWLQIKARPWLWGAFVWNMFDFSNDSRTEGDQHGRNDKGLVTYDRHTRKDAFYWYQANWTTNAMVHIVSKRFWERSLPRPEAKVYSNCDEVELKVNGVSLGKAQSDDCRFIWPDVELQPGPNRIEAYAYRAGRMAAADWGGWTYRADGDPRPNRSVADADAVRDRDRRAKERTSGASISNP